MLPIAILAAAPFEISPLLEELSKQKIPYNIYSCGIGPLNAAQNLSHLRQEIKGKDVIYVGTCGVFSQFNGVELLSFSETIWSPISERVGLGATIEGLHPPISIPNRTPWLDLADSLVLTSEAISSTSALSASYWERWGNKRIVENLEAYLCAQLAKDCKSFTPILAVTNQVGWEGRQQWRQNYQIAAQKTAEYVISKL